MSTIHVAAGPTARPPPDSETPAQMDRTTWAIVLGSLALAVVGIATAMLVNRGEPPLDLSTPGGVTLAYELAIQRGEADAAWEFLASSARAGTTRQEFLARAAGLGRGSDVRFSVENVRADATTAHLDLVRIVQVGSPVGLGAGTRTVRNPVTLVLEDGRWRISVPSEPFVILRDSASPAAP
jgi:hypothetical protein